MTSQFEFLKESIAGKWCTLRRKSICTPTIVNSLLQLSVCDLKQLDFENSDFWKIYLHLKRCQANFEKKNSFSILLDYSVAFLQHFSVKSFLNLIMHSPIVCQKKSFWFTFTKKEAIFRKRFCVQNSFVKCKCFIPHISFFLQMASTFRSFHLWHLGIISN